LECGSYRAKSNVNYTILLTSYINFFSRIAVQFLRECALIDQVFPSRLIMEKDSEFDTNLQLLFTDIKQISDSMNAKHIHL
jgi:hypothetical protein